MKSLVLQDQINLVSKSELKDQVERENEGVAYCTQTKEQCTIHTEFRTKFGDTELKYKLDIEDQGKKHVYNLDMDDQKMREGVEEFRRQMELAGELGVWFAENT